MPPFLYFSSFTKPYQFSWRKEKKKIYYITRASGGRPRGERFLQSYNKQCSTIQGLQVGNQALLLQVTSETHSSPYFATTRFLVSYHISTYFCNTLCLEEPVGRLEHAVNDFTTKQGQQVSSWRWNYGYNENGYPKKRSSYSKILYFENHSGGTTKQCCTSLFKPARPQQIFPSYIKQNSEMCFGSWMCRWIQ